MLTRAGYKDPEGFYHWAGALAQAGALDSALAMLERSVRSGFYAGPGLARNPWLDPLRALPDFTHIVRSADELQREALDAFRAADGPRVLGVPQL